MKASEGKIGRVFMLVLEDGDPPVATIEKFAADNGILAAQIFVMAREMVAGILATDAGGAPRLKLVKDGHAVPEHLAGSEVVVQEILGVNLKRVLDPASGTATLAPIAPSRTRVMERPAPTPDVSGPGTVPVYLLNVEFN